jgi:hypothetical protein
MAMSKNTHKIIIAKRIEQSQVAPTVPLIQCFVLIYKRQNIPQVEESASISLNARRNADKEKANTLMLMNEDMVIPCIALTCPD